jgi:hypothetical protein
MKVQEKLSPTKVRKTATNPRETVNKRKTVDIFCRVVDNYGDAGVCWRLARQMAFEHGLKVRLIIDQLDVLASLVPKLGKALNRTPGKRARVRRSRSPAPALGYLVDGVRIFEWKTRSSSTKISRVSRAITAVTAAMATASAMSNPSDARASNHSALVGPARLLRPAQLVIAAFACDLPESYRLLMSGSLAPLKDSGTRKSRTTERVWINLEYLSAEPWVATHHLLPSPKPSGLTEHFFFPGFTAHTGGLMRERDLLAKRDAFLQDRQAQERLAAELGIAALFDRPRV